MSFEKEESLNSCYLCHILILPSAWCSRKWDVLDKAKNSKWTGYFFPVLNCQFRRSWAYNRRFFLIFCDTKGTLDGLLLRKSLLYKVLLVVRWDMCWWCTCIELSCNLSGCCTSVAAGYDATYFNSVIHQHFSTRIVFITWRFFSELPLSETPKLLLGQKVLNELSCQRYWYQSFSQRRLSLVESHFNIERLISCYPFWH